MQRSNVSGRYDNQPGQPFEEDYPLQQSQSKVSCSDNRLNRHRSQVSKGGANTTANVTANTNPLSSTRDQQYCMP